MRRWQSGASPIPAAAQDVLDRLESEMGEAVEQTFVLATDLIAGQPVVLWRYRTQSDQDRSPHAAGLPLGAHAMLVAWTADALEAEGLPVQIEWAKPT